MSSCIQKWVDSIVIQIHVSLHPADRLVADSVNWRACGNLQMTKLGMEKKSVSNFSSMSIHLIIIIMILLVTE